MTRKTFARDKSYGQQHRLPEHEVVIALETIDHYKSELARMRDEGLLRRGTYQNRSTSLNILIETLLEIKGLDPENPQVETIRITARDIYLAIKRFIRKKRPAKHTLAVYLGSAKICLKEILFKYYNIRLSQTIGYEVFDPRFYLNDLSPSSLQEKGKQLEEYIKNEERKVVTDEQVKDALRWMELLLRKKKRSRTLENLRLALIMLLFTGARASELNDLQFEVRSGTRVLKQIDLSAGIIYFHRAKIKDTPARSFTPVFIHPLLTEELKTFKRMFIIRSDEPIFGYYGLDKLFYRYFRPDQVFSEKELEKLYQENPWLNKYPPNKPIIGVSLLRKYVDSYIQERIFEMEYLHILDKERENLPTEFFEGGHLHRLDNMRKYKNYLLGRVEGIDFYYYISVTQDKRFRRRYQRFTKLLFDGLIERLMPELLLVLSPEVRKKLVGPINMKPEWRKESEVAF